MTFGSSYPGGLKNEGSRNQDSTVYSCNLETCSTSILRATSHKFIYK